MFKTRHALSTITIFIMNMILKRLPILSAVGLLCITACSIAPENRDVPREPNPYKNGFETGTTSAKTTGIAYLTDIVEIGLFDGAGRVHCLTIDKADSNHWVAGAATGGLWKTNDRGRTWTLIDDHLPSLNIRSISQNPFQTNIWYASTQTNMRDGGPTAPARPDIYKSTDNGQTFQLIPATAGTFNSVVEVICSPVDQNTVFAMSNAFGGGAGVYRSTDNGQTFSLVQALNLDASDIAIFPDGSMIVSAGTDVYRSPNGTAGSFTLSVNGLNGANTFNNISFAYCQGQPNNVFAVTTGGNSGVGVFRSTNAGASWNFVQSIPTGVFTRTVGVKPDNPNFVFAGSTGLYLTQNAGSNFSFYPVGGVDWWSVNFDPHNPNKVIMTFDQGISEVNLNPFNPNGNTAYVKRDSLLNCAQIYLGNYFPYGDRVVIGMQDLGTQQAWVGGRRNLGSGDGAACFFHKQDTTIAYGSTQNGGIFKKINQHIPFPLPGFTNPIDIANQLDANNDGTIDEGAFFIHSFQMNEADGEQLYFPTKRRLWRSLDGGDNWQPVSVYYDLTVPGSSALTTELNHKPDPIVYWTVKDTLYIKPNAATTGPGNEIKVKMPNVVRMVRRDLTNDSIVYITASTVNTGARLYRSSNLFLGNVQWTDLTGDIPDGVFVRCVEVNPQDKNQMVVGTSEGLYVSDDAGAHWQKELQFPNVNILHSSIRPSDNRLFIFTYGRGAWAANFPNPNKVETVSRSAELKVWPNPAQDVVHVAVPQIRKNTSVQIWSLDGRLLKTMGNLQHTPCTLTVGDLPAGTYLAAVYEGSRRISAAKFIRQ